MTLQYPGLQTVPTVALPPGTPTFRTAVLAALRKYGTDPLDTAGSKATGGRYNPPEDQRDAFEVLYLSENLAVAQAEGRAITVVSVPGGGVQISPGSNTEARVDICVRLTLKRALDLTDPAVLAALHVTPATLMVEWLPLNAQHLPAPTQRLAAEAKQTGRFDALIFPSARFPGGKNYAVFPDIVPPQDRVLDDPEGIVMALLDFSKQEP